jgi:hypothetical protein
VFSKALLPYKSRAYSLALIKKRQYWPKYIPGNEVTRHFDDKKVGDTDALAGCLHGVRFHVYAMKEPDYVLQLMSTYGSLTRMGNDRTRQIEKSDGTKSVATMKYPEVVYNHYKYRGPVDHNNSMRMHPIALEEVWKTHCWATRVFQFILSVTEVNVRLALLKIF